MLNQDLEHLRILAILHYVAAGLLGFLSCFPLIYVTLGAFMLLLPQNFAGNGQPPPPPLGWFMVILGGFGFLFSLSIAICILVAGRCLSRRKRRLFCLIVAGICCLWMPLGTILGIFTFLVLLRPTVTNLFEEPVVLEAAPES